LEIENSAKALEITKLALNFTNTWKPGHLMTILYYILANT
jgi:hypothetical protein